MGDVFRPGFPAVGRRVALAVALALSLPTATLEAKQAGGVFVAPAGEWVVDKAGEYRSLVIPEGTRVVAPAGKTLTLAVNGVSVPIRPGTYAGKVVLTPADDIVVKYHDLEPHHFRTAVYIDNGRYVAGKSVPAAVLGGDVGDGRANGLKVESRDERFNGIIVTGDSKYVIDDPVIDLTGNGGNDFAGFGAAIMTSGKADVVVNRPRIRTRGAVRTAVFVGGHSTLRVNDADIEVFNGALPPDYKFTIEVGKMMEVPWMLGLSGNVRATNLVDYGTVYYTNSHIRAQGWGVLSTDDAAVTRMYVKDSLIETVDSGYGAYSIGDTLDSFSNTTFNVADIGLIMAGQGSGLFTDGTVVNSRRYGVMMHSGNGGGTLTIEKGSVFNTRTTAIQVKGRGAKVLIDDARIHAGNGVILQAMVNDDPFLKKMMAGGPPAGPIVGEQATPAPGPGGMPGAPPDVGPDVDVVLRNVALNGDFLNTRTEEGALSLKLENASVVGAISTGAQAPIGGQEPTPETYWQIGDVVNTLGPASGKHGIDVSVGSGSKWVVTRDSYLTGLALADGAQIAAPPGYRLTLRVDGKDTTLTPGRYNGRIEFRVQPLR
ncbi:MAG: hypothetical protein QM761_10610 [Pseudoxanthomonas sp.]